jgi:ribosomal protein L32
MTVRMRHTRSHTNNRRSHHKLAKPAISKDEAGNSHLRHRVSMATGSYRGRKVIDLNQKLEKKMKKVSDKTARS